MPCDLLHATLKSFTHGWACFNGIIESHKQHPINHTTRQLLKRGRGRSSKRYRGARASHTSYLQHTPLETGLIGWDVTVIIAGEDHLRTRVAQRQEEPRITYAGWKSRRESWEETVMSIDHLGLSVRQRKMEKDLNGAREDDGLQGRTERLWDEGYDINKP